VAKLQRAVFRRSRNVTRPKPWDGPHRGALQPVRQSSGTRLSRRPAPNEFAVLHQWHRHEFHAGPAAGVAALLQRKRSRRSPIVGIAVNIIVAVGQQLAAIGSLPSRTVPGDGGLGDPNGRALIGGDAHGVIAYDRIAHHDRRRTGANAVGIVACNRIRDGDAGAGPGRGHSDAV